MPFSIFRNRTLTGANVVGILTGASLFSMFFFISLYMQNVLGFSAIEAGLAYLPLAVSIIIAAGIASQVVTRIGFKPILRAGMVLIVRWGCSGSARSRTDGSFLADVLGPSLVAAVGLGFAFVPQTIAAMSGVADREAGSRQRADQHVAAGGRRAWPGHPLVGRVLDDRRPGRDRQDRAAALTEGYADAFLVGAGIGLLGVIATLVLIRGRDSKAQHELEAGVRRAGRGARRGLSPPRDSRSGAARPRRDASRGSLRLGGGRLRGLDATADTANETILRRLPPDTLREVVERLARIERPPARRASARRRSGWRSGSAPRGSTTWRSRSSRPGAHSRRTPRASARSGQRARRSPWPGAEGSAGSLGSRAGGLRRRDPERPASPPAGRCARSAGP